MSLHTREISKEGVHHSHSHIEFNKKEFDCQISNNGESSRSSFFKNENLSGLFNFQQLNKTPVDNIKYCIKEDDIIYELHTDEAQLDEIKQMVLAVQKSMKMEQRDKLLEAFIEAHKDIPQEIPDPDKPLDIGPAHSLLHSARDQVHDYRGPGAAGRLGIKAPCAFPRP